VPRPFGRSLDPLPEEDIGGYLLRLAAHLYMPLSTLVRALGLCDTGGYVISRRILLKSGTDLGRFAELARLTTAEVRALTLREWNDRYQPIETALALRRLNRDARYGTNGWLFAKTPRHCPSCLAGDGRRIQNQYGGAWKRIWRLPIAFACTEHQVFLSEGCGARHAERSGGIMLITSSAVTELHPSQCRLPALGELGRGSRPCGNRLDRPAENPAIRPTQRHLEIQRRISDQFGPDVAPSRAKRFLADIQLISVFLNRLPYEHWGEVDDAIRDAIADTASAYPDQSGSTIDAPPHDVVSTATLFAAAIEILADPQRQVDLLQLTYSRARHTIALRALEKAWARSSPHCTPAVHQNLVGAVTDLWARYGEKHAHVLQSILDTVTPSR
jgi:hypothetical protein